ncbi:hypothetical protein G3I59_08610 [Amycolatopsis rubida]|uniref:Uncharacterized protein n=1 Tax=Amycolatopsis rubida TaxID=112413 RepID=A0ABX0BMM4_9PSEU|nr:MULTISPECIES: hypothetical protein [Amycolatopsis]MYW90674.1 hypothetical protein [Amycolatopsis rubida]NEC55655.1 hypothetical protein [Amycolatopsis rubida]OAP23724.1 hypothetical protein A4R44_05585 [Amycolatopsis sp. M39]
MTRHAETVAAASRTATAATRGLDSQRPCAVLQVRPGEGMAHALDRYLASGYDIESAADGWVLLRSPRGRVALTTGQPPRPP